MGMLGKKIGMTQVIFENGKVVPVTVIDVAGNIVTAVKTNDRDGYEAVQVGYGKVKKLIKPLAGLFKKNEIEAKRYMREFKDIDASAVKIGDPVTMDMLPEKVNVIGITKGKGFQGNIRRHGAGRGPMSHGSKFHRAPGSQGGSSSPSRVFKGKKMPGRMGGVRFSAENITVVKRDDERGLLFVKGTVPGANGSLLKICNAPKAAK
jgi:large subunit ribosomal protein L3